MGNNWEVYKLEDILEALIDYRGKTPKKTTSGVPLVTAKIVKNGRILEPSEFIAEQDYEAWMRRGIPRIGDIVLTTEAPLGEVAQISDSNIALAQRIVTLRGKEGILDNGYLKYFLLSNKGQNRLEARQSGTTVFGIKQSELRKVEIDCPPFQEQGDIASILSALDDKIELNLQMNKTLEEMAMALYKHWFVDFGPFQEGEFVDSELGMIPESWEVTSFENIIILQRGFDLPAIKRIEGKYPVFGASGRSTSHHEMKVHGPGVTTGRSGVIGDVCFINENFWPLNTTLWVKEYRNSSPYHAYFFLKSFNLKEFNSGSAVPTLNRNDLHRLRVIQTPMDIIDQFSNEVKSLFDMKFANFKENQTLTSLRDTLLPKLISGEIRVKNAEKILADAL